MTLVGSEGDSRALPFKFEQVLPDAFAFDGDGQEVGDGEAVLLEEVFDGAEKEGRGESGGGCFGDGEKVGGLEVPEAEVQLQLLFELRHMLLLSLQHIRANILLLLQITGSILLLSYSQHPDIITNYSQKMSDVCHAISSPSIKFLIPSILHNAILTIL